MKPTWEKVKLLVVFLLTVASISNWRALPAYANERMAASAPDAKRSPEHLPVKADGSTRTRAGEAYGRLPLSFEANQGQFDPRVLFASRTRGQALFLTANQAVLTLCKPTNKPTKTSNPIADRRDEMPADFKPPTGEPVAAQQSNDRVRSVDRSKTQREPEGQSVLRMKLPGANRSPVIETIDELPGRSNYFIGNDPKKWRTGIANFAKIRYRSVYPGIDLIYHGEESKIEYDFTVAPGANPKTITLAFPGAKSVRIDESGDLILRTSGEEVRQLKPIAYQEKDGRKQPIAVHYVMKGRNQVGFDVSAFDRRKSLVIDPVLSYSTYLGGSSEEAGNGIAIDTAGNAYVTGYTVSSDFPIKNAFQSPLPGFTSAFVTKLNPTGTALVYSTYLGGSQTDVGLAIAVDASGDAYVTGYATSTDFPIVNAVQPTHGGSNFLSDAFVTRLNPSGNALVYSTYLGGSRADVGQGIAVDPWGAAYVTGYTMSTDFPTASAIQPALLGRFDAFATKLNPGGSLGYSTYLGGSGSDNGYAVAVDSSGQAYVAGGTTSPDFPLLNPMQPDFKGRTIFKSTDGGGQWNSINNGLPAYIGVNAIVVDPGTPATVFAGTTTAGIFKSTSGGNSWVSANTGLGTTFVNALAVHPKNTAIVFAATVTGVYKSTNGGGSWSLSQSGPSWSVTVDPTNPSTVYAGSTSGICKSTNAGSSWNCKTVIAINSSYTPGQVNSIAVDPVSPSTIYLASNNNFIFRTTDGGSSWFVLSGLDFGGYKSLVIDPSNPATIYAGSKNGKIYKSNDHGDNWLRQLFAPLTSDITLAIDRFVPSMIYAGTFGSNVMKSTDGGASWIPHKNGLSNSFVRSVTVDPTNTSTIYAGSEAGGEGFVVKINAAGSALVYSTYLGGDETNYCTGIAVDGSGSAYVTGATYATNFPTVNPIQASAAGFYDSFVAKLNSTGSALVYATYLGGSLNDTGAGIAVDPSGNAYVTGGTISTDLPSANPLPGAVGDTQGNAFVAKVNTAGSALVYSTYVGGPPSETSYSNDAATSIAVDSSGNAYVTGQTFSSQFPITAGAIQANLRGSDDAFISKIADFDACIQDESNGNILAFNSTTGDYQFVSCGVLTLTGTAMITRKGCLITMQVNGPDRRLLAKVDTCAKSATATIQVLATGRTFSILDRNTANNSCICAAR